MLNVTDYIRNKDGIETVKHYLEMDSNRITFQSLNNFQYFPDPVFFPNAGEGKVLKYDLNDGVLKLGVS